jgi:hypothetical protein
MSTSSSSLQHTQLTDMATAFLTLPSSATYEQWEWEGRFQAAKRDWTLTDMERVSAMLRAEGWVSTDHYLLRITPTRLSDTRTNTEQSARLEIEGLPVITHLCEHGNLSETLERFPSQIRLVRKSRVPNARTSRDGAPMPYPDAIFTEFQFRSTFRKESRQSQVQLVTTAADWAQGTKHYRLLHRQSFERPWSYDSDYSPIRPLHDCFRVDLSLVRTVERTSDTLRTLNWAQLTPTVEMEIEALGAVLSHKAQGVAPVVASFLRHVQHVLSALQQTPFPVKVSEQHGVMAEYLNVFFPESPPRTWDVVGKHPPRAVQFIGPSPVTLNLANTAHPPTGTSPPLSLQTPLIVLPEAYCVTAKADGERALLWVSGTGRMYLITPAMEVIFTGAVVPPEKRAEWKSAPELALPWALDGEWIRGTQGESKFWVFDAYYGGARDLRALPYASHDPSVATRSRHATRMVEDLYELDFLGTGAGFRVCRKAFEGPYSSDVMGEGMQLACHTLVDSLRKERDQLGRNAFPIDGLVFMPAALAVGATAEGHPPAKQRVTWPLCFKWKQPDPGDAVFAQAYTSVDFLVRVERNEDGSDRITPSPGTGNWGKTLRLDVGGYEPTTSLGCERVLTGEFATERSSRTGAYQARPFAPTDPMDPRASTCWVPLVQDDVGVWQLWTEQGEVIQDDTVIECRYEMGPPGRWIPLRIRQDKTRAHRTLPDCVGANDAATANSNWHSLHHPVPLCRLCLELTRPLDTTEDTELYYGSSVSDPATRATAALRDFHNRVKRRVLLAVCSRGDTLLDLACGKAGDLSKWKAARLSLVWGIDLHESNLTDPSNGACARYLNGGSSSHELVCFFTRGDMRLPLRHGPNVFSETGARVRDVLCDGQALPKNKAHWKALASARGKAKDLFHVVSCQFAVHYACESWTTLLGWASNVTDNLRKQGYLVVTCLDGEAVHAWLREVPTGDTQWLRSEGQFLASFTKQYDDSASSSVTLGMAVEVNQPTFHQPMTEYLVPVAQVTSVLASFGLVEVPASQWIQTWNLPGDLAAPAKRTHFDTWWKDEERRLRLPCKMTPAQRELSSLHRVLVYQKQHEVHSESVTADLLREAPVLPRSPTPKRTRDTSPSPDPASASASGPASASVPDPEDSVATETKDRPREVAPRKKRRAPLTLPL